MELIMNRRLRRGDRCRVKQTAVYLDLWIKTKLMKKANAEGYSLSSYIRKLCREDLGIPLDAEAPQNIVFIQQEDGSLLVDVIKEVSE